MRTLGIRPCATLWFHGKLGKKKKKERKRITKCKIERDKRIIVRNKERKCRGMLIIYTLFLYYTVRI